ncbi:polysaccharide deacetylase, partial [Acinetobacter baumannii]|nr:polysaccharide deacetylase [Acinetobacter baumannii]
MLSFVDWSLGSRKHMKSLTIAGTSFSEMRTLLTKAHKTGIDTVVILTHPFEYVQSRDASFTRTRTQFVTQQRLRRLCQYLQENDDAFEACGLVHA